MFSVGSSTPRDWISPRSPARFSLAMRRNTHDIHFHFHDSLIHLHFTGSANFHDEAVGTGEHGPLGREPAAREVTGWWLTH